MAMIPGGVGNILAMGGECPHPTPTPKCNPGLSCVCVHLVEEMHLRTP